VARRRNINFGTGRAGRSKRFMARRRNINFGTRRAGRSNRFMTGR